MQMDDRPADLRVRLGRGAGKHVRLDAREQPALGRRTAKSQRRLLARHVVGEDALDRAHRAARVGGALGHFLRVDAAVEHRQLVVQLAPGLPEDGRHLPLDLLGREHPDQADVVQLRPPLRIGRRGGQAVGAVEVGDDPVLEDALEIEAGLREADGDRFDLLALFLVGAALGGDRAGRPGPSAAAAPCGRSGCSRRARPWRRQSAGPSRCVRRAIAAPASAPSPAGLRPRSRRRTCP